MIVCEHRCDGYRYSKLSAKPIHRSHVMPRALLTVLCAWLSVLFAGAVFADDPPLRNGAVVYLNFDEAGGDALDTAASGAVKDVGRLQNGPQRVSSPFWGQSGKRALRLNAGSRQYVRIDDSADVDAPNGVTVSLLFINLHAPSEATFHGLFAKRAADGPSTTNYGINFHPKADAFQVYLNDGSGFRVAQYSAANDVGYRRPVFLTATWSIGDAPAPDADTDADDVFIRLFINGKPLKPKSINRGQVAADGAWTTDVKLDGFLNDVPLTIGASYLEGEFLSAIVDEFLLFPRALETKEVERLFAEVVGPEGVRLAGQKPQPPPSPPQITLLSRYGLQLGAGTRLSISGSGLGPNPRVVLPIAGAQVKLLETSRPNRLDIEVQLPDSATPGFYPLRVVSDHGVGNAVMVAVDRLPEGAPSDTAPEKPAALPAAFSGVLSGSNQPRVYFRARRGDRIVAEVESRRLGANFDPVVEIKNHLGAPLAVAWSNVVLRGDARAETTIPKDGLYYVELHDLAYRAPGRNPFRLKVGDLKLVDAVFPPVVGRSSAGEVSLVGTGLPENARAAVVVDSDSSTTGRLAPESGLAVDGPLPVVQLSDAVEVLEQSTEGKTPQTIRAVFDQSQPRPVAVNGRLLKPGERDEFLLEVAPGSKLRMRVLGRALASPIDASLRVLRDPDRGVLASKDDSPGSRDPQLDYTVPTGMERIRVEVSDLFGGGGEAYCYRLIVEPADVASLQLVLDTDRVNVPARGATAVRMEVRRRGFGGPIALAVEGDETVAIQPARIAPGANRVFVTLFREDGSFPVDLKRIRIVGRSVGITPEIRAVARQGGLSSGAPLTGFEDQIPLAVTQPVPLAVEVVKTPPALLKGLEAPLAVRLVPKGDSEADELAHAAARLTLLSTEKPRPANPQRPNAGNKPLVRALSDQLLTVSAGRGEMLVVVPADVAERAIDFVVRADLLRHEFDSQVIGTTYSAPFRLPVRNAVTVKIDAGTLNLVAESENRIRGTIQRAPGYTADVRLTPAGLQAGYSSSPVTVKAGQQTFELIVKTPRENERRAIPGAVLKVTDSKGRTLLPDIRLAITCGPKT